MGHGPYSSFEARKSAHLRMTASGELHDISYTDTLSASGLTPVPQQRQLRGIPEEFAVYEIP